MITVDDVKCIAYELKLSITENEAIEALNQYIIEQEKDSNATWDLVIENCLYNIVAESVNN
jgi:hypothetical protein